MNNFLSKNSDKINELCQKYHVNKLYAFGSVISNKFTEKSDVDLIIYLKKMNPIEKGEILMLIWDEFENIFKPIFRKPHCNLFIVSY